MMSKILRNLPYWISFKEEVPLIQSRLSVTKVAYLLCRFWPLVTHPIVIWVDTLDHSNDFCDRMFRVPLIIFIINFALASAMLSIRLYAFTRCNRKVAATAAMTLSGVCIYQIYTIAEKLSHVPTGKCYPIGKNPASGRYRAGYFFAPVLFDCNVVIIFLIYLIENRLRYTTYSGVLVPWGVLLPNVLACRLMLSMRRAVSNAVNETTPEWSGFNADQSKSTRLVFALVPIQTTDEASQLEDGIATPDGKTTRQEPLDIRQDTELVPSVSPRD
ncbi:hypothetical protein BKA62DRAFT_833498 [Auriculariales sp. MPI-PUGE-AT-0066]|nr:hypothetical protein BKA62DRAFT_833498 [Auriculariales sp. MPI-PUGE-AT-0066]